jgi:hypothetical protein
MADETLRGVLINTEEWGIDFPALTSAIPLEHYKWWVTDIEAWSDLKNDVGTDLDGYIDGGELRTWIGRIERLNFGKFVGFPSSAKGNMDLETYDEFVRSDAQIILLVVDGYYYEFYFKDHAVTHSVAGVAQKCLVRKVELTTDDNDGRTRMDVW